MAHAVALMAEPLNLNQDRQLACHKISAAMMAHPMMVAGPGKFDTELMTVAKGKVFCKTGAEGYYVVGVMPGSIGQNSPGVGIAIKISDGDHTGRARASVTLTILSALGVLIEEDIENLASFGNVLVKNWRELVVGEIRPAFSLKF